MEETWSKRGVGSPSTSGRSHHLVPQTSLTSTKRIRHGVGTATAPTRNGCQSLACQAGLLGCTAKKQHSFPYQRIRGASLACFSSSPAQTDAHLSNGLEPQLEDLAAAAEQELYAGDLGENEPDLEILSNEELDGEHDPVSRGGLETYSQDSPRCVRVRVSMYWCTFVYLCVYLCACCKYSVRVCE